MSRLVKKRSIKAGLPPGSPVYIGDKKEERLRITIIDYDEARFREREAGGAEECFPLKDGPGVRWINIDGVHHTGVVEEIGRRFNLHPLVVEDIVNTGLRPKMDDFGEYIFVVVKMLWYDDGEGQVKAEQVSLVLGRNFVISFQERVGDVFDPLRERLRQGKGRTRKLGADYLTYALIDLIVDSYFAILEKLGEKTEELEAKLVEKPGTETLHGIHRLKRELLFLRKSVWPLREEISGLQRMESPLIAGSTAVYLRDVYDHTIQVIDTIETLRDMASGMLDTYLSSVSNRMNEIMKVLTIIASIFIPLTYIAGIYGMNFEFMPELKLYWGYPAVLLLMLLLAALMLACFKRKKWL